MTFQLAPSAEARSVVSYAASDDLDAQVHKWARESWYDLTPGDHLVIPRRKDGDRSSKLAIAAKPELDRLEAELDEHFVILLADANAYLIDRRGDPELSCQLDAMGAVKGASCSESVTGNNGIGTVIEEGRSMTIVGAQHFADELKEWATAGSPIVHHNTHRTIGAVAICTHVEHWNPLLSVIAHRSAAGIADAYHAAASQTGWPYFVDEFVAIARHTRRPVVGISDDFIVMSPSVGTILKPADHNRLVELLHDPADGPHREFTLADGTRCQLHLHEVVNRGRPVGCVVELAVPWADTEGHNHPVAMKASLASGVGDFERTSALATRRWRQGRPLLLAGEPGVGKTTLAVKLAGSHGPCTSLDARLGCDTPGWFESVHARLLAPARWSSSMSMPCQAGSSARWHQPLTTDRGTTAAAG